MSAATKSAMLLALTLAVGILLGLTGASSLERRRHPRPGPPERGGPGGGGGGAGLVRHMEDVIRPKDSVQARQVRTVLERTAEGNRDAIRSLNDRLRASMDAMKAELAPILDAGQRSRLDEATRRLPAVRGPGSGPPFGRGGRGGPGDGPPGRRGGGFPPPP